MKNTKKRLMYLALTLAFAFAGMGAFSLVKRDASAATEPPVKIWTFSESTQGWQAMGMHI